ncbi:SAM-dependent methyltransferase [Actinomadura barringtoniae]|uniref:SAM-dependent methyltransferase n=1 Tax=Actinomadura barringtoniae TaxID=1427535 RepID=UPI0027DE9908|nr:SAM-dependent methyltransferase [Actinomadura barringtoniae]
MAEERADRIDASTPHIARIYDYWLGGKDNFAADREAAEKVIEATPAVLPGVRANRRFLGRAVRYMADQGVRQFLDLGTGIPASNNTHEVAQAIDPDARVVYVDNDPIVLAHAHALLTSATGTVDYLEADAREVGAILETAAKTLDLSKPVGIMLIAILHCIPDEDDPKGIVDALLDAVPAGSHLAISHPAIDQVPEYSAKAEASLTKSMGMKVTFRRREQVQAFCDGLELVEPGVVPAQEWRPDPDVPEPGTATAMWGAVARKP